MTQQLLNMMRREAERVQSQKAATRIGIVTSYDPATYSAKVRIQPEDVETGFLQIASPWVGDGWGMLCPPTAGDVVDVHYQEASKGAPYISLRFFGDGAQPPSVPSREFWLVHKSGSLLKFHNDGSITSSATLWTHTGDFTVMGEIRATGDIIDRHDTDGDTMASFRAVYDSHTHKDTMPGSGNSGTPNQEI